MFFEECSHSSHELVFSLISLLSPVNRCSSESTNPCKVGTCRDTGDGLYTCICPQGFYLGTSYDGSPACAPSDYRKWDLLPWGWNLVRTHLLLSLCSNVLALQVPLNGKILPFNLILTEECYITLTHFYSWCHSLVIPLMPSALWHDLFVPKRSDTILVSFIQVWHTRSLRCLNASGRKLLLKMVTTH